MKHIGLAIALLLSAFVAEVRNLKINKKYPPRLLELFI